MQGMPYSRQLALLAAAQQATALTIHMDQVEGLLHAFTPQQQQEQQQDAPAPESTELLAVQKGHLMPAGHAAPHSSDTTPGDHISSSSSQAAGAPGALQAVTRAPPAAKPCQRRLTHLTIRGQPTCASLQQLEQLLDALPGTQHLQQIVLDNAEHEAMYCCSDITKTPQGALWTVAAGSVLEDLGGPGSCSTPPTTSAMAAAPSGSSSSMQLLRPGAPFVGNGNDVSWRDSCHTVLVGQRFGYGTNRTNVKDGELVQLLGRLQQLRALFLHKVQAGGLEQCAPHLKGLRALHLGGGFGFIVESATLKAVAALTNLRHLGLNSPLFLCDLPNAFTALAHLSSLDLNDTEVSEQGLEVVCSITSLRRLDLTASLGRRDLPDGVSRLACLEQLVLNKNRLGRLPDSFTCLHRLVSLQLKETRLYGLPGGMTGLQRLEWTGDYKHCMNGYGCYSAGWERLVCLTGLQHLFIYTTVSDLPSGVSVLAALTELVLKAPRLQAVHCSLSALQRLERLTLLAPQLTALPEGITSLTQLRYIKAYSCTSMPGGLSPAVQVHTELYIDPQALPKLTAPGV
jgi:hypothetical protein